MKGIRSRFATLIAAAALITGAAAAPASAVSVAQASHFTVIAAVGPAGSLLFYSQLTGGVTWHPEYAAGFNSTFSAPSVAQVGNSAVIAAEGPDHTLWFSWQTTMSRAAGELTQAPANGGTLWPSMQHWPGES